VDVDFVHGHDPAPRGRRRHGAARAGARVDPEVRTLAEAVIAAQEAEIAWMRDWLAARGY
jgi:hypothetical protein